MRIPTTKSKWLTLLQNCTPEKPNQFNQIISHAIVSGVLANHPFISSQILLHSLPHGLDFSRAVFSQIQNPNVFACNFIFKAYSNSPTPRETLSLYNLVRRRFTHVLPDKYSFPFLFKACGRVQLTRKGQELHALSFALGVDGDVFVQNGLISMYSACGELQSASKVFELIPVFVRDVVSWNSIVSGCLQSHRNWNALQVFVKMLADGSARPDAVAFVNALNACARLGSVDLGRKIHGLVLRNGFDLDVFLGSSLVDMYAKCGDMDGARKVFDRMGRRNVVSWTCMIAGYVQSHWFKEAIELFREMQLDGVKADSALVACVVSACGNAGALDHGRWVHSYCERSGIEMNLSVKNALIDMYSKCGDFEKALEIFCDMTIRDVVTWTAMIIGLAMNGESDRALEMFSEMEGTGYVRPNEVTFLGVLSACSHGGFVNKGLGYLEAMSETYKLTPRVDHYGCVIDLLGRANLLNEAARFISAMPIQPDVVIWRSLLFACRTYQNLELAEFVARKIEELEPRKAESSVLLSHLYASASRWLDVNKTRKGMPLQGIQKKPGCSLIEVDGLVHEFTVADCSHCERISIYETLGAINRVIQSERYS
ncbi:putative pentatricopeptide [Rosa chinensis]|uniref:Putative pentatricopeptide n=1 Tax=Rosa chinensis TaxID=74649 RepID=A0A2P6P4G0_ROSCH|nr:pentatricopeptide repeat-containing protein At2g29760, chloroplastic [Rosa chinensis]PRQ16821.1 putative pentatricopeptide [Rosa chinensis]